MSVKEIKTFVYTCNNCGKVAENPKNGWVQADIYVEGPVADVLEIMHTCPMCTTNIIQDFFIKRGQDENDKA